VDVVIGVVVALVVSALVGSVMIRFGPRLGFVDLPDGFLKSHQIPAVPLGGVAVFAGVHLGLAVAGQFSVGLLLASAMVFVLGLMDDYRELGPAVRLGIEVVAGAVLAVASDLPAIPDGPLSIVLVAVLVVVTVNAVNLLDGLDGLAGSVAAVTALGIAAIAATRGLEVGYGLVLAAALGGFLIWNWYPAKMFLGDNGAYSVAVFLVYGFLVATPPESEVSVLVAAGLLGVFAVDLLATLIRRRLNDQPLFAGDRSHVYDQLIDRGWRVPQVAATFAVAQGVIGVIVVAAAEYASPVAAVILLAVLLGAILFGLARSGFLRESRG
jgi:UDP-GlcNAc:undecaprenyl-phosphate GlcNAc-1-phosphate transferase